MKTDMGPSAWIPQKQLWMTAICLTGITTMVVAVLVGPLFSPAGFSWLRHTTSEQAGQLMEGAWIMRAGFFAFGGGVLICSILDWTTRPLVRMALAVFGLGLIASAVWSNAPILVGLASDETEDRIHSMASWVVGMAFIGACAARLFAPGGSRHDPLAWLALIVSVSIPMLMAVAPEVRGLLQRAMFAISFVFVAREYATAMGDRQRRP